MRGNTPVGTTPEMPGWHYLRFVTRGQAVREFRSFSLLWLIWSALSAIPLGLGQAGLRVFPDLDGALKAVSPLIWLAGILAFLSWIMRGVRLEIPKYGIWGWLGINLYAGALMASVAYLPPWAYVLVFSAAFSYGGCYTRLLEIGRENREILAAEAVEAECEGDADSVARG
jgi:hypothetical protein